MDKSKSRFKVFVFKDREYKIEFPTVGQYIDIETEKIELSSGKWSDLVISRTVSAYRAIQLVECIAVLKILCPKLFEDMKVSDYKDIDAIDFTLLLKLFTKEINPWYSSWFKEFNDVLKDISEGEQEIKEEIDSSK